MNKVELKQAVQLAEKRRGIPFSETNLDAFNGFGLRGFKPIAVTLADVADLIRYQTSRFDGTTDLEALNEIAEHGRRKFVVVG